MFNVAQLFGDWGRLIEIYRWTPADLFGRPDGLAWAIKSHHYPVTAIGPRMAMMRDERVWRRGRKES
jgi:hypothetical protein